MIEYNEATKEVTASAEFLETLPPREQKEYEAAIKRFNRLRTELVNVKGENLPAPNALTPAITVSAKKLVDNSINSIKAGKPEDAVKVASTALEMVLRRPLIESTEVFTMEVSNVLQVRCDAYIMNKQLDLAYADASLLGMLNPMDPNTPYRKGVIMYLSKQYKVAEELLKSAIGMKENTMYRKMLEKVSKELK